MYEKTNCDLMVQRYKQWPSTTNLFSEAPRFFNKILQEGTARTAPYCDTWSGTLDVVLYTTGSSKHERTFSFIKKTLNSTANLEKSSKFAA